MIPMKIQTLENRIFDLETALSSARDELEKAAAEITRLREAIRIESHAIEQTLGAALGYPYADHTICPQCDPVSGCSCGSPVVIVGEHVPASLAMEAANTIEQLRTALSARPVMPLITRETILSVLRLMSPNRQSEEWAADRILAMVNEAAPAMPAEPI